MSKRHGWVIIFLLAANLFLQLLGSDVIVETLSAVTGSAMGQGLISAISIAAALVGWALACTGLALLITALITVAYYWWQASQLGKLTKQ